MRIKYIPGSVWGGTQLLDIADGATAEKPLPLPRPPVGLSPGPMRALTARGRSDHVAGWLVNPDCKEGYGMGDWLAGYYWLER